MPVGVERGLALAKGEQPAAGLPLGAGSRDARDRPGRAEERRDRRRRRPRPRGPGRRQPGARPGPAAGTRRPLAGPEPRRPPRSRLRPPAARARSTRRRAARQSRRATARRGQGPLQQRQLPRGPQLADQAKAGKFGVDAQADELIAQIALAEQGGALALYEDGPGGPPHG